MKKLNLYIIATILLLALIVMFFIIRWNQERDCFISQEYRLKDIAINDLGKNAEN